MSHGVEVTGDEVEVHHLLELCRHRLLLHASNVKPEIRKPHLMFDTPVVDEPPSDTLLLQVRDAVDGGDTVLLSFADERRREFVHHVAQKVGWKSVKMAVRPADARH